MKKHLFYLTMILSILLTGCDKLEDGDSNVVKDVLPGGWAFSYELVSEEETGLEFEYEMVYFNQDGTVRITYPDGEMTGTYVAGSSIIKIEGNIDGETREMIWRILSLSDKYIKIEYKFDFGGQDVTAIVELEKVYFD